MNEAETYNFVMSQKRGRGGVHKEYTFIDDEAVVIETLERDFRLEDAEYEEDLIKSAVNAQINNFFEGS
jgi:cell division control protein 6